MEGHCRATLAKPTSGFIRQAKGKSLIAPLDVKQKLILCLWKKYRKYIRDVLVIPWKLQHRLMVIDLDKTVVKMIARKKQIIRRKIWKLSENRTRVKFEKKLKELTSTDAPNLWKTFKDGVLKACDEVCEKKSRKDRGDMWWWNNEVKDTIA